MAQQRPEVVNAAGTQEALPTTDTLEVGAGIAGSAAQELMISSTRGLGLLPTNNLGVLINEAKQLSVALTDGLAANYRAFEVNLVGTTNDLIACDVKPDTHKVRLGDTPDRACDVEVTTGGGGILNIQKDTRIDDSRVLSFGDDEDFTAEWQDTPGILALEGKAKLTVPDDDATAFGIAGPGIGEEYVGISSDDTTPEINLANETNNPDLNFRGRGRVDFGNGDNTLNIPSTEFAPHMEIGGIALSTTGFTAAHVDQLLDGSNCDDLHTHGLAPELDTDTTLLAVGSIAAPKLAGQVDKCDAESEGGSRFAGVYQGAAGKITFAGLAEVLMTTDGGMPGIGEPIYIAQHADDTNTGDGKGSALPPPPEAVGSFVAEVGICWDNDGYGDVPKTCTLLIQPKEIHER